jgi:hypothetical protein
VFTNFFLSRAVYEKMWKNAVELERPQMTIYCGLSFPACKGHPFACRVNKAKNTHSEYVTLTVFLRQQWLHERALILRYTYIACLVDISWGLQKSECEVYIYVPCFNCAYPDSFAGSSILNCLHIFLQETLLTPSTTQMFHVECLFNFQR